MKELILILLIIFASLAFGAEIGGPVRTDTKIQLPYDFDKEIPKVGLVHTELRDGPAIDEFTMDIYVSCVDKKTGKLKKAVLVNTQKACEYRSEIYKPDLHTFIFQFRKYNMSQSGPSKCDEANTDSRKVCFELANFCDNRPQTNKNCEPQENTLLQQMPNDL